jgi:hypothetical protein
LARVALLPGSFARTSILLLALPVGPLLAVAAVENLATPAANVTFAHQCLRFDYVPKPQL